MISWNTFLVICLGLWSLSVFSDTAYTYNTLPNPTAKNSYISNPDKVLSNTEEMAINQRLKSLEHQTNNEVVVVVVKSIGNSVPKEFAVQTFNHWGIGKKGKDNGLLILLVMNQRRIEFEVGYGLEGVLTDLQCGRIIRETMTPLMKSGAYAQAINGALDDVKKILGFRVEMENSPTSATNDEKGLLAAIADEANFILRLMIVAAICILPFWLAFRFKSRLMRKISGTPQGKDKKGLSREENLVAGSAAATLLKDKETISATTQIQDRESKAVLPQANLKKGISFGFILIPALVFHSLILEFWDDIDGKSTAIIISLIFLFGNFGFFVYFQKKSQDLTMKYVFGKSKDFPLGKKLRWLLFPMSLFILSLRFYMTQKRRYMTKMGYSLLKEEAEDIYLTPSQITEEKIGSVEYDVFKDPNIEIVLIKKNILPFGKYKKCEKCLTLSEYVEKDVVTRTATYSSSGNGVRYYCCHHCSCRREEYYVIPKLSGNGGSGSSGGSGGSFGGGRSGGGGAGGSW
jgi:uncharacterized protein